MNFKILILDEEEEVEEQQQQQPDQHRWRRAAARFCRSAAGAVWRERLALLLALILLALIAQLIYWLTGAIWSDDQNQFWPLWGFCCCCFTFFWNKMLIKKSFCFRKSGENPNIFLFLFVNFIIRVVMFCRNY